MLALLGARFAQAMGDHGASGTPVEAIATMQARAMLQAHEAAHPHAPAWVLPNPAGGLTARLHVDTTATAWRLVDITVAPVAQRDGVGTHALRSLLDAADRASREVRGTVMKQSPAARWYLRHGFQADGGDALYLHLIRTPRATQVAPPHSLTP